MNLNSSKPFSVSDTNSPTQPQGVFVYNNTDPFTYRAPKPFSVTSNPNQYSNTVAQQKIESGKKTNTSGSNKLTDVPSNGDRIIKLYKRGSDYANPYYAKNDDEGVVDVLMDGGWCLNPKSARIDIVKLILTEYQPKFSPTANDLIKIFSQLKQFVGDANIHLVVENPIENTFIANKTGFSYIFPFLSLGSQSFTTSFGDADNKASGLIGGIVDTIQTTAINALSLSKAGVGKSGGGLMGNIHANMKGLMKGAAQSIFPAVNPANPEGGYYQGSSPVSYTISIDLLNTISLEQTQWNKEFIELITHNAGMGNLRNAWVGDSPCIYTLEIKGIRWCPACHINVTYEGVGVLQNVAGEPTPEAYKVSLEISEVYPPLRFVTDSYLMNNYRTPAILEDDNLICNLMQKGLNAVKEYEINASDVK